MSSNDIPGVSPTSQHRIIIWTIEEIRRRFGVGAGSIDVLETPVTLAASTTLTTISSSLVTSLTAVLMTPLNEPATAADWYVSSRTPGSNLILTHLSDLDNRIYQCVLLG